MYRKMKEIPYLVRYYTYTNKELVIDSAVDVYMGYHECAEKRLYLIIGAVSEASGVAREDNHLVGIFKL